MSNDAYDNMTAEEMEFAVFCVGLLSKRLGIREEKAYELLDRNAVFQNYIVDFYDILHTQSPDYIADDIIDYMKAKKIIEC